MVLDGIRVIEFSQYIPGAYTGLRLAELGAEVIKVEPPNGDPTRSFGIEVGAEGVIFSANNRNKKSIVINLKTKKGQLLARELVSQADIIIENFRPGVMAKFGLDYQKVKEYKENIVYCSISGYGETDNYCSHDLNYQALSGILSQLTDKHEQPILPKLTFADKIGGLVASERILGALIQRGISGRGMHIKLSLMEAVLSFMETNIVTHSSTNKNNIISQLEGNQISYNLYETKDGRFVSIAALESKFWKNFCLAVDHEEWIPAHQSRISEEIHVYKELKELFKSKTIKEWTEFGLKVDCCLAPVLEVGELNTHPLTKNKYVLNDYSSPGIDEHSQEIKSTLLNKSAREIKN